MRCLHHMDRLQFIGQTHKDQHVSADDIVNFFDHTMAAYELVHNVDDVMVCGNTDILHSSLKLKVESPYLSELEEVVNYINNTLHNRKYLYDRTFNVDAKVEGSYVELFVRAES